MKLFFSISRTVAAIALLALFSTTAFAQATRTWVSGVGDDANPCSRTAPCKTFAGAISKTAGGGVISVLDPGGFGAVTITKSITLENDGAVAGILNAGTNGVIVNAAATDDVVLRGISIEGAGTGLNGIRFLNGKSLTVERCTINNQAGKGIDFSPAGASTLTVTNTQIHDAADAVNGGAISITPTGASGVATAAIDNVQLTRSRFGLKVQQPSKVTIANSLVANNDVQGLQALGNGAQLFVDNLVIANNGTAVVAATSAIVTLSRSAYFGNTTGLSSSGGAVINSFGDNRNANTNAGNVPTPVGQQ